MNDLYSKTFGHIKAPDNLVDNILIDIDRRKNMYKLKRHIFIMLPILFLSLAISTYTAVVLRDTISVSGLPYFLSLIISDTSTVLSNFNSFLVLIAESIPGFSVSIFLLAVFGMLKASQYIFINYNRLTDVKSHIKSYANT